MHCQRCGQTKITHNDFKRVVIRLPRASEKTTLLVLRKQRFRCKNCGKTILAPTPLVRKQYQISDNNFQAIDISLTKDRTMSTLHLNIMSLKTRLVGG